MKNNKKVKKGWGLAQVVKCLPSKYKSLSLNPITAKKKKKIWRSSLL
jgi:hypothetical protein